MGEKSSWICLAAAAVFVAVPVCAQVQPGSDYQVNSVTSGNQSSPDAVVDSTGDFLVVWQSETSDGTDTDGTSIQGRWFSSDGTPVASDFQVNEYTAGDQRDPAVAVNANGDFMVVWASYDPNPTGYGPVHEVKGRVFDSQGGSIGSEVQITRKEDGNGTWYGITSPSIASNALNDFMVVWRYFFGWSGMHEYGKESCVRGRLLGFDGTAVGSEAEFQCVYLDYYASWPDDGNVGNPEVALRNADEFLVVWDRWYYDSGSPGDFCDQFDYRINGRGASTVDGSAVGGVFQINESPRPPVSSPALLRNVGEFVVAWKQSEDSNCYEYGNFIQARSFDSLANPTTNAFQVNVNTSGSVGGPSMTSITDGDFLISWSSTDSGGDDQSGSSIQARLMGVDGTPVSSPFQVNRLTIGDQDQPELAGDSAVWRSASSGGADDSGTSIQAIRGLVTVFSDGFEAGNSGAWSASVGAAANLENGLVSYWDLDDGSGSTWATDRVGSNDGQLVNMNPASDWVAGKFGGGLGFDGTDDHVLFGNDSSLDVVTGLTVSAWIKTADVSGIHEALSKNVNLVNGSWSLIASHDDNPLDGDAPRANVVLETGGAGENLRVHLPDPLPIGSWHHLVMTYNTFEGAHRFYIDGVEGAVNVDVFKRPIQVSTADLVAGAKSNLANFFEGDLDDIALWNRALGPAEVSLIWNGGAGNPISALLP